jgi:hypothetical protein
MPLIASAFDGQAVAALLNKSLCLMPLHPASSVAHWEPDTSYGEYK